MDSDIPDLGAIHALTQKYDCLMVIDCAHSMFVMGKSGLSSASDQIDDFSNVVMIGSGSKTLGSNFGWLATGNPQIKKLVGYYAPSFIFTNSLPPSTCNTVMANVRLLTSQEGDQRRARCLGNAKYVIDRLTEAGYECIGAVSPIVIVFIGPEVKTRAIGNFLYSEGIICNPVEYPAVPIGEARLRLQIQPGHTKENLDHFVEALKKSDPIIDEWIGQDNLVSLLMTKMSAEFQKNPKL
jgi:glycine C-acetyltransferase